MSTVTVVTPATSIDLITVAQVKADLDLTVATYDSRIAEKITQASRQIANYCRRTFGLETVSETFRLSRPESILKLSRYPVVTLDSVTVDGELYLVANYEIDFASGIVSNLNDLDSPIIWGGDKNTLVYSSGYNLPSEAPEDLQGACLAHVKSLWIGRARDSLVRALEVDIPDVERIRTEFWVGAVGGASSNGFAPDVQAVLDYYRDPIIR